MKYIIPIFILLLAILSNCGFKKIIVESDGVETKNDVIALDVLSSEEYQELTQLEKQIIDKIGASINGLKSLSHHSPESVLKYSSTFIVSLDEKSIFNYFILLDVENQQEKLMPIRENPSRESCESCTLSLGVECARKMIKTVQDNGLSELGVTIKKSNDCYDVSWQSHYEDE
ncbi:MAG: hypothetical protein OXC03_09955 [Flavobacteriaceae bacterium]|nr:hypothetical protein [Flavobacteriaceae bacterium]